MSKLDKKAILRDIDRLFNLAINSDDAQFKKTAVKQAILLARSIRVKIPKKYSLLICRKCFSLLSSPNSARIRVRRNRNWMVAVKCLSCGAVKRIPLRD